MKAPNCLCNYETTIHGRARIGEQCLFCRGNAALETLRGQLAARLLEARIKAYGPIKWLPDEKALAKAAMRRADALIEELLK